MEKTFLKKFSSYVSFQIRVPRAQRCKKQIRPLEKPSNTEERRKRRNGRAGLVTGFLPLSPSRGVGLRSLEIELLIAGKKGGGR